MNPQDIVSRTRAYIQKSFLQMRPGFVLEAGDPFFAKGIIDSMGAIELAGFLHSELGIAVAHDETTEQNLGTLAAVSCFLVSKCSNGRTP